MASITVDLLFHGSSCRSTGCHVWLLAPASGVAALPLLLVLICPLSMAAMAWRMRSGDSSLTDHATRAASDVAAAADVDADLRALREELAIARARRQFAASADHPFS